MKDFEHDDYINHLIFNELDSYIEFYDSLSFNVLSFPTVGTTALMNMDTYVYMSIKSTIESIKLVLQNGKLNDAYALLRKYYDSVIINAYTNLYLSEKINTNGMYVPKINDWLRGKKKLPRMSKMTKYLNNSTKLSELNKILYSNDRYDAVRNRCNDNMHYNSFSLLMINDGKVYVKERMEYLEQLKKDIKDVFILNVAYILYINHHYMMSTDYMDYLDCGMSPPEGSEYWVAPFIKDMFKNVLNKERKDIYSLLKQSTNFILD